MGSAASDLDNELDAIFARRDRGHMQPTIDAFEAVLQRHPGHARVLYEVGGSYDTDGQEERAVGFYERALAQGLDGELRRRCLLQYGSTLRNLDRFDDSSAVFAAARAEFPDSVSLAVFQAITCHAAGRVDECAAILLETVADHVESAEITRYEAAIRGNAEFLRERAQS